MVMRQVPKLLMRTNLRDHVVVGHVRGVVAGLVHCDVVEILKLFHGCFLLLSTFNKGLITLRFVHNRPTLLRLN
jgi:hypothetical protein